jgi:hypothetical protein
MSKQKNEQTEENEDPTIKLIPWTRTMGKALKMAVTAQGQVIARRGSVGAYRRRKTPTMSRDSRVPLHTGGALG